MKRRKKTPAKAAAIPVTLRVLKKNAILASLEAEEANLLLERGSIVTLDVRAPIYSPDVRISEVYFPIDCVLSVVTRMQNGDAIEIGTVGREGFSGIPLLFGASSTANECYCQVPGSAVEIDVRTLLAIRANDKFRQLLDRYVQAYVNMLGQMAACNRLHSVYERCARWLLMTQDRAGANRFELTHEYLAMMLGTQRSGVTIAAGTLQKAGFISYAHGTITIVDRDGLEGAACECYDVAREQFGGLLRTASDHEKPASSSRRTPPRRGAPSR